jgi:hypothetical protein
MKSFSQAETAGAPAPLTLEYAARLWFRVALVAWAGWLVALGWLATG